MSEADKGKSKNSFLLVELIGLFGLVLLGTGLWLHNPIICLIIMGSIFFFMAFLMFMFITGGKRNLKG